MTVKEFIKELSKHDPDLHVFALWEGQAIPMHKHRISVCNTTVREAGDDFYKRFYELWKAVNDEAVWDDEERVLLLYVE